MLLAILVHQLLLMMILPWSIPILIQMVYFPMWKFSWAITKVVSNSSTKANCFESKVYHSLCNPFEGDANWIINAPIVGHYYATMAHSESSCCGC